MASAENEELLPASNQPRSNVAAPFEATTSQPPLQLDCRPAGVDGSPEDKTLLPSTSASNNNEAVKQNIVDSIPPPDSLFGRPRRPLSPARFSSSCSIEVTDETKRTQIQEVPINPSYGCWSGEAAGPACILNIVTSTSEVKRGGQDRRPRAEASLVAKLNQCKSTYNGASKTSPRFHQPNRRHIIGGGQAACEVVEDVIQLSGENKQTSAEMDDVPRNRPLIQMLD